jgi:hypothetical protein
MVHISRKLSSIKVIKTGLFSEIYLYKFPIEYGFTNLRNDSQVSTDFNEQDRQKNIKKSANRARNNIRRLITGNLHQDKEIPKFLTTTFKNNIQDLTETNYHYKKFIQRLEYKLQRNLHYLTVHEKQERGAIHYHSIFFNFPRIDQSYLQKEWGGHVWIKNVYKTKGLFSYLTKYITKSFEDESFKGKKRYFQSLVNQPETIRNQEEAMAYYSPLLIANTPLYTPRKYSILDKNGVEINEVTKSDYLLKSSL